MQAALRAEASEPILHPGNFNPLNEQTQIRLLQASRLDEGMVLTPSRFRNNTGLDAVFRNLGALERAEAVEAKIIKDFKPNEIGKAVSTLKGSRWGVQGSDEYVLGQGSRLQVSRVATPAMRETGRIIQTAPQLDRTLVIMDQYGNIFSYDPTFWEMLKW
jgi:hypothetical protein